MKKAIVILILGIAILNFSYSQDNKTTIYFFRYTGLSGQQSLLLQRYMAFIDNQLVCRLYEGKFSIH